MAKMHLELAHLPAPALQTQSNLAALSPQQTHGLTTTPFLHRTTWSYTKHMCCYILMDMISIITNSSKWLLLLPYISHVDARTYMRNVPNVSTGLSHKSLFALLTWEEHGRIIAFCVCPIVSFVANALVRRSSTIRRIQLDRLFGPTCVVGFGSTLCLGRGLGASVTHGLYAPLSIWLGLMVFYVTQNSSELRNPRLYMGAAALVGVMITSAITFFAVASDSARPWAARFIEFGPPIFTISSSIVASIQLQIERNTRPLGDIPQQHGFSRSLSHDPATCELANLHTGASPVVNCDVSMGVNILPSLVTTASGTVNTEITASSTVASDNTTASVTRRHTQSRIDEENDPVLAQLAQPKSARFWSRVKRALT